MSKKKNNKPTSEERNVTRVDTLVNEYGVPADIKVNDRQFRFCQLYIETLNATQSYLEVYNCTYDTAKCEASKLLAKPNIKECISWLIRENSENIDIEIGEIMSGIKSIALDKSVTPSTRLKAYELLAKVKGMTNPEVEVNIPVINVSIIDDDNNEIPMIELNDTDFKDLDE